MDNDTCNIFGIDSVNQADIVIGRCSPQQFPYEWWAEKQVVGYKFTVKVPIRCTLAGYISYINVFTGERESYKYYEKEGLSLVNPKAYPDLSITNFNAAALDPEGRRCVATPDTWELCFKVTADLGGNHTLCETQDTFINDYWFWVKNGGHIEFDITGTVENPYIKQTRG